MLSIDLSHSNLGPYCSMGKVAKGKEVSAVAVPKKNVIGQAEFLVPRSDACV